jgi:glutathione S-transferase
MEYIDAKYGGRRLSRKASDPGFAQYLYWFHYANASFQALLHRTLSVSRVEPPAGHRVVLDLKARLDRALGFLERRLGEADYLAGSEVTLADLMIVFSLTTMRSFTPYDLKPYSNILAYLRRIGAREAYRRARAKADPGMAPGL